MDDLSMESIRRADYADKRSPDPFNAESVKNREARYKMLKAYIQEQARRKHLNFIDYMWTNPSEPFTIGAHTRAICNEIDAAVTRYKAQLSTFLVMAVPFRHGKALDVCTPILTLTGWKRHGDIKPGDYVFDRYGAPVQVEAVTPPYNARRWRVSFVHGEFIDCAGPHEWIVQYKDEAGHKTPDKILETRAVRFQSGDRKFEVLIDRRMESNELAEHNGGRVIPGNIARIGFIRSYNGDIKVNCIQVYGGEYLAGRGLVPTHNSEIISRKLPAHFLGLFPDGKVLMTGHTAALSVGYSKESRNLLLADKYKELFPETQLNPFDSAASHWKVAYKSGEVFACGLGGSMAGQGYTLGIVDDFCRNRADAESATMRERMWNSFTNDFLTRRAPRSITIVTATPWHVDDIIGRIKKTMKEDPRFPPFKFLTMPAFSEDYETGTLFPERFSKDWYEEQRAALGSYGSASLLQCAPAKQGGNILQIDNIKRKPLAEFPDIPYTRIWDLAHTERQRNKPDPDWTSGTLLGMRRKPGAPRLWEIWVKDVQRFRLDSPQRDARILNTTERDGPFVKIGIENSVDSRDAFNALRSLLLGRRIVEPIQCRGDKVVRASALEPIFEAGDIYAAEGAPWFPYWKEELGDFPNGAHDDMVDNLTAGYAYCAKPGGSISVPVYEQ
jgi:predicted phage terminase large subunit-like protein